MSGREYQLSCLRVNAHIRINKNVIKYETLLKICETVKGQCGRKFEITQDEKFYTVTRLEKKPFVMTPRIRNMENLLIGQSLTFDRKTASRYSLYKLCISESIRQDKRFELIDKDVLGHSLYLVARVG